MALWTQSGLEEPQPASEDLIVSSADWTVTIDSCSMRLFTDQLTCSCKAVTRASNCWRSTMVAAIASSTRAAALRTPSIVTGCPPPVNTIDVVDEPCIHAISALRDCQRGWLHARHASFIVSACCIAALIWSTNTNAKGSNSSSQTGATSVPDCKLIEARGAMRRCCC